MSGPGEIEIRDIDDEDTFALVPPCADGRFDHRSCDYWEDDVRGAKTARPHWWTVDAAPRPRPRPERAAASDNPFAPPPRQADTFNPFASDADDAGSDFNPFAPPPPRAVGADHAGPRKLRLLGRGRGVSGSYAKVALLDGEPAAYAQFGPLTAYPRAQVIRELYPQLPASPLPAVITCVATTSSARGRGLAAELVEAICSDLAQRGFAAVEAYPDTTLGPDEASAATPAFWERSGFAMAAPDERYPVMRRALEQRHQGALMDLINSG